MFSCTLLGVDVGKSQAVQPEFARMIVAVPLKKSSKPDLFLQQSGYDASGPMVLAGHRSHSSHSSHSSHYSGSGGYSSPSVSIPPSITSPKSPTESIISPDNSTTNDKKFKIIYLKSGVSLPCDSAWVGAGIINFVQHGTTYTLPLGDIDLEKTLQAAE